MKKYEQIYKDPKQLERETNEFIKDFDNKRQQVILKISFSDDLSSY